MQRVGGQEGRQRRLASLLAAAVVAALAIAFPASASADVSLTIQLGGSGSGTVECRVNEEATGACAASYPEGTEVELLPSPGAGSLFTEFTGACTGDVCDLILNESQSVTAIFTHEIAEYLLEINQSGNGEGEVECLVGKEAVFCEEEFPEGTHVTVKATPYEGSKSAVFAGDCTGGTCNLIMDKDHTVTVIFNLKEFALTVQKSGGSTSGKVVCELEEGPEPCKSKYPWGTEVILIAIAEPSYEFLKWDGCDAKPEPETCEVEMDEPRTVTVTFGKETVAMKYALEVVKAGTGTGTVASFPSGINCTPPCSADFNEGTQVTLVAAAASGSEFVSWSGCTSQPEPGQCKVTMTSIKMVTVTFNLKPTPEFALTITKQGTGGGTVKCKVNGGSATTCAAKYAQGTSVELVPIPDTGSEFVGWSGDCSGIGTCALTLNGALSVVATFGAKPPPAFTLSVQREGAGSGSVVSDPSGIDCGGDCSADYPEGTVVTLAATPGPGSTFKRWIGVEGGCALEPICRTRMGDSKLVKAVFDSVAPEPRSEPAGMVKVAKRTALVRGGRALLELRCLGGPCKGGVRLIARLKGGKKTLVVGKQSFVLTSGVRKTVQIKLSASAKREVSERGDLAVEVAGGGVLRSSVKLKKAK